MVHHVYEGRREGENGIAEVFCDGSPFYHYDSQEIVNHSPTGFEWGYGGSGPAQLAVALLLEVTDEETAVELHQAFKWEIVAAFGRTSWRFTSAQIRTWLMRQFPAPIPLR